MVLLNDVPTRTIAIEFARRVAHKLGGARVANMILSPQTQAEAGATSVILPESAPEPEAEPETDLDPEPEPAPELSDNSTKDEPIYTPVFHYDGLWTDPKIIHNHDFMREPRYIQAYEAGFRALAHDHEMFWRLHVALWSAHHASRLQGDFVECGVWRGFLTTAILTYLEWESLGKTFYLFDTFDGLAERYLTEGERANVDKLDHLNSHFRGTYEFVTEHFAKYPRVEIVRGPVPETLSNVMIDRVSYLSIDMNCTEPEIAAINHFWDKLVPGAIILLDDYGFVSYEEQKRAMDTFAASKGVEILALPTGQGVILKN